MSSGIYLLNNTKICSAFIEEQGTENTEIIYHEIICVAHLPLFAAILDEQPVKQTF